MQSDFTKVTEKNLIAVECGLPLKDRLYFFRAQGILFPNSSRYTDTCNRNKCHATHLHLQEGCCFSCKEITLSAFQV